MEATTNVLRYVSDFPERVIREEGPEETSQRRRAQSADGAGELSLYDTLERRDEILEQVPLLRSRAHLLSAAIKLATVIGVKGRLIRKSAFYPPKPESYKFAPLPPSATNSLVSPPTSTDKILVEECLLLLKTQQIANGARRADEHTVEEAGSVLSSLPSCKLRVAAFRLRRIADGDMTTAAMIIYKPIYKSEAPCAEDRADMLTDLQLRPLVLFSHGNSTDLGYNLLSLVQLATRLHVNVLTYDYPDYGLSKGKLNEKTMVKAFKVTYDFARQRLKVPRSMIFLYGQSIGSVPTSQAAGQPELFPCSGVVLHSPLASALRILAPYRTNMPTTTEYTRLCSSDCIMDNNSAVRHCPWPLLILHGCKDDEVPAWHGCQLDVTARQLALAAPSAVALFTELVYPHLRSLESADDLQQAWARRVHLWLPEFAGHHNIEILYKPEYFRILRSFIARFGGRFKFP